MEARIIDQKSEKQNTRYCCTAGFLSAGQEVLLCVGAVVSRRSACIDVRLVWNGMRPTVDCPTDTDRSWTRLHDECKEASCVDTRRVMGTADSCEPSPWNWTRNSASSAVAAAVCCARSLDQWCTVCRQFTLLCVDSQRHHRPSVHGSTPVHGLSDDERSSHYQLNAAAL